MFLYGDSADGLEFTLTPTFSPVSGYGAGSEGEGV